MTRGVPNSPKAPSVILDHGQSSTADLDSERTTSATIPLTGDVSAMERTDLSDMNIVQDTPAVRSHAADLQFMEDILQVQVADTNEEGAEQFVQVGVNGVNQFFPRGQTIDCKRKYVEGLARAKPSSVRTPQREDGAMDTSNKVVRHSALKYPFTVVHDPRGKVGVEWLKGILRQG